MTFCRQGGIQSPEYLYDTECGLGHRLGDIAAGRGYGSDCGQGAFPAVFAETNHMTGTLIELSQTASQISGITFLTGHLLQTSGHLTESLGPPGCGVRHQGHRITHITEILCNRDTCIN